MKYFRYSFLLTAICIALAAVWGSNLEGGPYAAVLLVLLLGLFEVSLSFDNAVVNAAVLREMDIKWRKLFLVWGILIAVFGMRLVFPLVVVAVATGEGLFHVADLALNDPQQYSQHLVDSHTGIAAFGGVFLLLIFLSFIFDHKRQRHWLGSAERLMARVGRFEAVNIIVALSALLLAQAYFPLDAESRTTFLVAGLSGAVLYVVVDSLSGFFAEEQASGDLSKTVKRSGAMGFMYLEILDASFSFDSVMGAFAITRDVVIIMLGLAIGAMFVRSLTVFLVEKGTLEKYVFLEHGAHYAIGALAFIMLGGIVWHISEVITGLIGAAFIVAAFFSSLHYRNTHAGVASER